MLGWNFDAFFWLVLPILGLEALRVGRSERKRQRHALREAIAFALLELIPLVLCAATSSPLFFVLVMALRLVIIRVREREWWVRGPTKFVLLALPLVLLATLGGVGSFAEVAHVELDPVLRVAVVALLGAACIAATLPVRIADEQKESLAAPLAFIVFARVGLPLGEQEPLFAAVAPVVAAVIALICALWLLSAGRRANHFEDSTLVSELLMCERGVVLSFVWLGLASGEQLAGIGALLQWWAGALALMALEASLRRRPVPKSKAFFALALAVNLPGTVGFVAEDLIIHGLLLERPLLAAAYVAIIAMNAAALYLTLVNVMVDVQSRLTRAQLEQEPPPSLMLVIAGALALGVGLLPAPFVDEATAALDVIAPHAHQAEH